MYDTYIICMIMQRPHYTLRKKDRKRSLGTYSSLSNGTNMYTVGGNMYHLGVDLKKSINMYLIESICCYY